MDEPTRFGVEVTDEQLAHLDQLDKRLSEQLGVDNVGLSAVGTTIVDAANPDLAEEQLREAVADFTPVKEGD